MDNKEIKLEEIESFDSIKDEGNVDINLLSINSNSSSKHIKQRKDDGICKFAEKSPVFLLAFECFQDLLIKFQTKLKDYEAISTYLDSENINVLPSKKWENLSEIEIQSHSTILQRSFEDTFINIIEKMTIMDNAIVRLQNENKKLMEENNKTSNWSKSTNFEDRKYSSIQVNQYKDLINEKEDLEKKCTKLDEKLKTLNNSHMDEITEFEMTCDMLKKENKKLKILVKELEEFKDNEMKILHAIVEQNKSILKEIQEMKLKFTEQNDTIERNLEKKICGFLESLQIKDRGDKEDVQDFLKELKVARNYMGPLAGKDNELESSKEKYKNVCEEKDILEKNVEILKEELKELFNQIQENKEELEKKIKECKNLRNILAENKQELEKSKEEYKEMYNQVKENNKELQISKNVFEKKERAMNNMKEKIKKLNALENSVEEIGKLRRRIELFESEKQSFEQLITSMRGKMKERHEECEQLKKDKLRLNAEFENMKLLNFRKKTED